MSKYNTLFIYTLLVLSSFNTSEPLRANDLDNFYDEYSIRHKLLVDHFWRKISVRGTQQVYEVSPIGKHIGTYNFITIASDRNLVYLCKVSPFGKPDTHSEAIVILPSESYELSNWGENGKFKIVSHPIPWTNELSSEAWIGGYARANLHYPFFELRLPGDDNDYFPKPLRAKPGESKISRVDYKGMPCIRIEISRVLDGMVVTVTVYLDAVHYVVLREEATHRFDYQKRTYVPTKKNKEIVYTMTPDGIPFPKSVKGWYDEPNGKRIPFADVEFTEYRRYTPTADEVDMEKQFGLQPLPLPPRPELPPASRKTTVGTKLARLLYGIAALFAAITVALIFRRRKTKSVSQPV
jgi:hypothetical protein